MALLVDVLLLQVTCALGFDTVTADDHRRNDPDERIRRRVRKTLAHCRRTGKVTDAAR